MQSEFHCADPECKTCRHHPCPPGQGVKAYGRSPTHGNSSGKRRKLIHGGLWACPQGGGASILCA